MAILQEMLAASASRHSHLCPRQVLGVRIGIAGLAALGIRAPVSKPTALIIVETDGCFVDGIEVATGATIGHRTLRVNDMGKTAATFVDVPSARSVRVSPRDGIRTIAFRYAPSADVRYVAQLEGYKVMPEAELLRLEEVSLIPGLAEILSNPDARAVCSSCGEEIINQREVRRGPDTLCRTCAGEGYYMHGPGGARVERLDAPTTHHS